MYYKGEKVSEIAFKLERNRTTISRALKCNSNIYGDYYTVRAPPLELSRKVRGSLWAQIPKNP